MKISRYLTIVVLGMAIFISCKNNNKEKMQSAQAAAKAKLEAAATEKAQASKYTLDMVDEKTDIVCKMPLAAGIEDTVHYKGKVYGFCSKECTNKFLKNPKKYLVKK